MSVQGSVLEAARFRTWLLHPSGKDVNSACVGWTKHAFANPLVYWVRSLLPEALAQQVSGINWRWGLLIGDGNCFPVPLWARFFAKAIEDLGSGPHRLPVHDCCRRCVATAGPL